MATVTFDEALDRLRAGETIAVTHPSAMRATDKPAYVLSGGGGVSVTTWNLLRPHLEECGDALFPDCASQTWRLAESLDNRDAADTEQTA